MGEIERGGVKLGIHLAGQQLPPEYRHSGQFETLENTSFSPFLRSSTFRFAYVNSKAVTNPVRWLKLEYSEPVNVSLRRD